MLALMTIIALAYSSMTRNESLLSYNGLRSAQAREKAESGIWLVINDLLKPINNRRFLVNGLPVQLGAIYPEDESVQDLLISIQDESGKIDLNKASQQLLLGLLRSTGVDSDQSHQIVDAILDWRDKDNLSRLNGAEDDDYAANGLSYGAKDGPFNSIGELQQVLGLSPSIYQKLQPLLTVHSLQSRIRLHTAPIGVLKALPDMSDELLAQIISERSTMDTTPLSLVVPDASKTLVFTSGQGRVFSITSEAKVSGVTSRLLVTFALKKSNNMPITILDWQENAPLLTYQPETELEHNQ